MLKEYYVLPDLQIAESFLSNYINGSGLFPVRGVVQIDGQLAPEDAAMTIQWHQSPDLMTDGRYAIPRVPTSLLDSHHIPQAMRDAVLTALVNAGGSIEYLDSRNPSHFPQPAEES